MNEYLARFRAQYPDYDDMSDRDLAEALHQRFYSDMSWGEFVGRIGLDVELEPTQKAPQPMHSNMSPNMGALMDLIDTAIAPIAAAHPSTPPGVRARVADRVSEIAEREPVGAALASAIPAALGGVPARATGFALPSTGVGSFAKGALRNRVLQALGGGGAGYALARMFFDRE